MTINVVIVLLIVPTFIILSKRKNANLVTEFLLVFNFYYSWIHVIFIKWPNANNKTEWCQSDGDADQILKATARGDAASRLQMCSMIICIAAEKFVMKEKHLNTGSGGANQQEVKISLL